MGDKAVSPKGSRDFLLSRYNTRYRYNGRLSRKFVVGKTTCTQVCPLFECDGVEGGVADKL